MEQKRRECRYSFGLIRGDGFGEKEIMRILALGTKWDTEGALQKLQRAMFHDDAEATKHAR